MLRRAQRLNVGQQEEYISNIDGMMVRATLFATRGNTGKEIGFITEGGESRYFVNYINNLRIGYINKNDDDSWSIYDKNRKLIITWP